MRLAALFVVGAVMAVGGVAQAQCSGGREATEASQGRCCWPGQVYSAEYGRCDGPPRCPAGLVASGNDCVAAPAAAPAVAVPVPVYTYPTRTVTQPIWGLAVAGIVLFGVMYVTHIAVAAGIGSSAEDVGYQAIPLAGPWVCMGVCSDPEDFIPGLAASGVIQLAGITMMIIGLAVQVEHEVRAELDRSPTWALTPWASPDGGGLALSLSHF